MNYTDKHLEHIDTLLARSGRNGDAPKLSPEASADPALKEAFHDVEMLWQATRLERLQKKLAMLKEYEVQIKDKAKAQETSVLRHISLKKRTWMLSIAAGVAFIVVAGWLMFRDQGPQTIQNQYLAMHFDEYILHDVMKSDNTTAQYTPEQLRAYNLFAIKDFKKAIPLLKKEWEEKGDTMALFYLVTAYVGSGDDEISQHLYHEHKQILSSTQQMALDELLNLKE